ncbi:Glycosyltransferase involved in cell wall bisynthesis [Fibrobacter sp. UWB13]|nr:Glycosyltransferase involved in cell wall bisynthesis [Fibrobacter sp. UWB13]
MYSDVKGEKMKKKLLIFHPVIAPYRIDFFNEFSKRFDAEICLFRRNLRSQKFDYTKIEKQFNFKPNYLVKDELGLFYWFVQLWKILSLRKNDAVIVSEFGIVTIIAVLHKIVTRGKYKIISMVDDSYDMVAANNQFSWKHKWATKILMPFMSNAINVEPRVVEYYQQKYGKGVYMPIIVDDERARNRLQRIMPTSQDYVKKYNLEGKKVLLFVGRLVRQKNISFAIDAFQKANVKDSVFVVVGDGPEIGKIQGMVKGKDNVILTGRLEGDPLYAWYNIAQVFTLPSVQEPFGAVTNEALLGGCYCLISKLAGSNCLIEENVNGNIIDPYNESVYINLLKSTFEKTNPITIPLKLRNNGMNDNFLVCFENMIRQFF